ncbi:threonine ammonia-lyase [Lactonifactor longoviformis]|uniref:threonine ammonia-lyase n=2 Tax=Lactonifactor TaxID=420345 RepID=A0A1M5BGY3_9CLOT|nr:threonine/serine dehydratase [Lactonifactor longoviformis]SHF41738.1 threonine dehydratase [Lactonifactor longoviformis DSM 17459]
MIQVSMKDIVEAYALIQPYIMKTPLIYSKPTSDRTGSEVWFKMDNLQSIGAYKIRGAMNNMMSLRGEEVKKGVVAASAGNHSQAVAYGARLRGTSAVVCVPESTPMNKREGALKYGAELVVYGPNYEEAEKKAYEIARETGRKFIHAYESPETIAGQGTVAIECLLEKGDFDAILVPTGGGGLLCGVAIAAKAMNPEIKVYGLQTNTSAPWLKSFHEKRLDNSCPFLPTCADGLEGAITWPNVELALTCVDDIFVVDERTTREGIQWMASKHHFMIEGASATCLGALFEEHEELKGKKVLCLITGGNIDLDKFCNICEETYE